MVTENLPTPTPNGYQPSPGEGLTEIRVSVRPSFDFQAVEVSGGYVFPEPRAIVEALGPIEETYALLEDIAQSKVTELVAKKQGRDTAGTAAVQAAVAQQAPAAVAPPVAPHPAETAEQALAAVGAVPAQPAAPVTLAEGRNPKGEVVKYVPTSVLSPQDFERQVKAQIQAEGLPSDQVFVYDNRGGQYGFESGNKNYSVAKVVARKDSQLLVAAGGDDKASLAFVDFNDDGSIRVKLSNKGESAKSALALAAQMSGANTPV